MKNETYTNEGESTSPRSLIIVLNTLQMEEENSIFLPLFISFGIFNCNVHNVLVDSSTSLNVVPFSIAKKINV